MGCHIYIYIYYITFGSVLLKWPHTQHYYVAIRAEWPGFSFRSYRITFIPGLLNHKSSFGNLFSRPPNFANYLKLICHSLNRGFLDHKPPFGPPRFGPHRFGPHRFGPHRFGPPRFGPLEILKGGTVLPPSPIWAPSDLQSGPAWISWPVKNSRKFGWGFGPGGNGLSSKFPASVGA